MPSENIQGYPLLLEITYTHEGETRRKSFQIAPAPSIEIGLQGSDLDLAGLLGKSLPYISRVHFRLGFDENGWYIQDCSRNGTWLDERRLPANVRFPLEPREHQIALPDTPDPVRILVQPMITKMLSDAPAQPSYLCSYHREILDEILWQVERQFSTYLVGLPGLGANFVLGLLYRPHLYCPRLEHMPVLLCDVDLCRMEEYTPKQFYALLLHELAVRVRLLPSPSSNTLNYLESLGEDMAHVNTNTAACSLLVEAIHQIGRAHRRHVLFTVRHFEILPRHLPSALYADLVRLYRMPQWRPTFLVAATDDLEQLDRREERTALVDLRRIFGNPIWLRPLDREDLRVFLSMPEHNLPALPECAVDICYRYGGGWPSLTVTMIQQAAEQGIPLDKLPDRISDLFDTPENSLSALCELIWEELTPSEQRCLYAMHLDHPITDPRPLWSLERRGVVTTDQAKPQVRPRILLEWVNRYARFSGVDVHVDRARRTIVLDGRILPQGKGGLSRLEFALLAHLAEHHGQVCPWLELYRAVYPETSHGKDPDDLARLYRLANRTRDKLAAMESGWSIENIPGVGLRLRRDADATSGADTPSNLSR